MRLAVLRAIEVYPEPQEWHMASHGVKSILFFIVYYADKTPHLDIILEQHRVHVSVK